MLFSIVIPVYNTEKYLSECIESVLSQTCKEYEIILVDDGSTDRSGEICDAYAKADSQIRVIHKKNEGLLFARRTGIVEAKGEYFVHLDSDDTLKIYALETIKNKIIEYDPDLIIIDASRKPDFSIPMHNYDDINEYLDDDEIFAIKKRISETSDFNGYVLKIARKGIVDIDKDYSKYKYVRFGEDLIQSLPLIDRSRKIILIKEPLYYYRPNEGSITHSYSDLYLKSILLCNRILEKYIIKWDKDSILINRFRVRKMYSLFSAIYYIGSSNTSEDNKYKLYNDLYKSDLTLSYNKKNIESLSFKQKMLVNMFMQKKYRLLTFILERFLNKRH